MRTVCCVMSASLRLCLVVVKTCSNEHQPVLAQAGAATAAATSRGHGVESVDGIIITLPHSYVVAPLKHSRGTSYFVCVCVTVCLVRPQFQTVSEFFVAICFRKLLSH